LLTQDLVCGELGNAAVSCRELVNAAVSCGSHLSSQRPPARIVVDADLSCGVVLLTQHLPARNIVDADLSCKAPSYTRGAHGSEGAQSYIAGLVAATAVAMETLKPVSKRDTMTHRGVRTEVLIFLGLGIRLLL
jgi:hypothetical protein